VEAPDRDCHRRLAVPLASREPAAVYISPRVVLELIEMNLRLLGTTIAAGIATVLVVGLAVTELLQPRIEFSLLVGIPAGLFAGAVVAAAVAWGSSAGSTAQRRLLASSIGAAATTFLVVVGAGVVLALGVAGTVVVGVLLGTVVGVAVAVVNYVRLRGDRPGPGEAAEASAN
jgi:hypothetical protein